MLKLNSISPSRIKTFDDCKFKYFLTYHRSDVTLKTNFGAVHGSLLHDILENYSNGQDTDWVSRLYRGYGGRLETLDRHGVPETMPTPLVWAKAAEFADKKPYCDTCPHVALPLCSISSESLDKLTGCPRDLFENSIAVLQKTIDRYAKTWEKILRNKDGQLVGTEYKFNIVVPGTDVPMIGIMDLVIEEDSETIHIIDYKAGTWTQDYEQCRNDTQVKMYSLASRREFIDDVCQKGYNYKNVILTFDYFTKNPVTLAFTKEEDEATERFVYHKIQEIQSTNWINRIVRTDDDFKQKKFWKCRSLCDTAVCAREWKGKFQTV